MTYKLDHAYNMYYQLIILWFSFYTQICRKIVALLVSFSEI